MISNHLCRHCDARGSPNAEDCVLGGKLLKHLSTTQAENMKIMRDCMAFASMHGCLMSGA